jgi:hypothetical protein
MQNGWSWNSMLFESVNRTNVKAGFTDDAWNVTVLQPSLSWGYCIILPDAVQSFILWSCGVNVKGVTGRISPGIAIHDFEYGLLFQMNEFEGISELRFMNVNKTATRKMTFKMADLVYPYDMSIEYNAITSACAGKINGGKVFDIKLPHGDIKAIFEVDAIEIVTTTPSDESGGTVAYGDLMLNCE